MGNDKNKKNNDNKNQKQNPGAFNDQVGENAGEGRWAKGSDKKQEKRR